ncbi:hypothetical protein EKO04_010238 [Ascochyta lentis]|uniref:Uncharacterized protein n=1 Tax=Ascochyta lentis TaxID=205686 RepID=A0A8H7IVH0_9PLEO|nr:hypothetical protein EKO04_010238 [Ascochyta lentis]
MALPESSLHLLTIPREIRNLVYVYLYKDLELRSVSHIGDTHVIFGLVNAPCLNLMLTHPRIYEEYKESESFTNLAASLTNIDHFADLWKWRKDAKTQQQDSEALSRIKHITLRFTHLPSPSPQDSSITKLIDALALRCPRLDTLMIGEFKHIEKYTDETLPKDLSFSTADTLLRLPTHIVNLHLTQRADCRWFHSFCAATTPDDVTHSFFQVRLHTFSSRNGCRWRWTPEGLETNRTPPGYSRLLRKVVREYSARMVEQKPRTIVGWREECCGGVSG